MQKQILQFPKKQISNHHHASSLEKSDRIFILQYKHPRPCSNSKDQQSTGKEKSSSKIIIENNYDKLIPQNQHSLNQAENTIDHRKNIDRLMSLLKERGSSKIKLKSNSGCELIINWLECHQKTINHLNKEKDFLNLGEAFNKMKTWKINKNLSSSELFIYSRHKAPPLPYSPSKTDDRMKQSFQSKKYDLSKELEHITENFELNSENLFSLEYSHNPNSKDPSKFVDRPNSNDKNNESHDSNASIKHNTSSKFEEPSRVVSHATIKRKSSRQDNISTKNQLSPIKIEEYKQKNQTLEASLNFKLPSQPNLTHQPKQNNFIANNLEISQQQSNHHFNSTQNLEETTKTLQKNTSHTNQIRNNRFQEILKKQPSENIKKVQIPKEQTVKINHYYFPSQKQHIANQKNILNFQNSGTNNIKPEENSNKYFSSNFHEKQSVQKNVGNGIKPVETLKCQVNFPSKANEDEIKAQNRITKISKLFSYGMIDEDQKLKEKNTTLNKPIVKQILSSKPIIKDQSNQFISMPFDEKKQRSYSMPKVSLNYMVKQHQKVFNNCEPRELMMSNKQSPVFTLINLQNNNKFINQPERIAQIHKAVQNISKPRSISSQPMGMITSKSQPHIQHYRFDGPKQPKTMHYHCERVQKALPVEYQPFPHQIIGQSMPISQNYLKSIQKQTLPLTVHPQRLIPLYQTIYSQHNLQHQKVSPQTNGSTTVFTQNNPLQSASSNPLHSRTSNPLHSRSSRPQSRELLVSNENEYYGMVGGAKEVQFQKHVHGSQHQSESRRRIHSVETHSQRPSSNSINILAQEMGIKPIKTPEKEKIRSKSLYAKILVTQSKKYHIPNSNQPTHPCDCL